MDSDRSRFDLLFSVAQRVVKPGTRPVLGAGVSYGSEDVRLNRPPSFRILWGPLHTVAGLEILKAI